MSDRIRTIEIDGERIRVATIDIPIPDKGTACIFVVEDNGSGGCRGFEVYVGGIDEGAEGLESFIGSAVVQGIKRVRAKYA